MSYDLQIFSCWDPASELSRLVDENRLERLEAAFAFGGGTWQVVFGSPDLVEEEDIPSEVFRELPGIKYLITVNIEGQAPASAVARATRLARTLAKGTRGVLVDPQQETVETPRGIKRVDVVGSPEDGEFVSLSWWFENADAFENGGCVRLVEVLETHAREALPRRYGLWEPPQFRFAENGREHFLTFLRNNLRDTLVWYPNRPFTFVGVSIPPIVGASRQGYRCCRLTLEAQARVLDTPGWSLGLKRLWLAVAEVVSPFFAEIRQGESPIKSWWWSGIPQQLGLAALVGPPYTDLWPGFLTLGERASPQSVFLETIETKQPLGLTPPSDIAQPEQPERPRDGSTSLELWPYLETKVIKYPPRWPFGEPFA